MCVCVQVFSDSVLHMLHEVYRERAIMARSVLKVFLELGKVRLREREGDICCQGKMI